MSDHAPEVEALATARTPAERQEALTMLWRNVTPRHGSEAALRLVQEAMEVRERKWRDAVLDRQYLAACEVEKPMTPVQEAVNDTVEAVLLDLGYDSLGDPLGPTGPDDGEIGTELGGYE